MTKMLKIYQNFVVRYPVTSQAIQTGLLMGAGDLIAQVFVEEKSIGKINSIRTAQFTSIGLFFVGPPLRIWYGILDKYLGNKGKMTVLKKVALDQLIFAPCFLAAFMTVVNFVQGNPFSEVKKRITNDYVDILKNGYKLWPAVQLCNFYLTPLQYQVVIVQIVALFWNTYLSWKMNQNNYKI